MILPSFLPFPLFHSLHQSTSHFVLFPNVSASTSSFARPFIPSSLSSLPPPTLVYHLVLTFYLPFFYHSSSPPSVSSSLSLFHFPSAISFYSFDFGFTSTLPTFLCFLPLKCYFSPLILHLLPSLIACRKLPDIVRCNVLSDSSLSVLK